MTTKEIYLAGGCFWGVQAYFDRLPGVLETEVGYANGLTENPTYEDVCYGNSGHAETVRIAYSPGKLELQTLLRHFFKIIDPVSENRQGNDVGVQYRTGIYCTTPEDMQTAKEIAREEQAKFSEPLAVELLPLEHYFPAEEYHQKYLEKNPGGYCHISFESLPEPEAAGGKYFKPPEQELRSRLTGIQYAVTRKNATEPPFSGEFWNHDKPGLYVDIVTGEPLFLSTHKFDSGCGWPSFSKPANPGALVETADLSHGMHRTEVRSKAGDSHLGHVFQDGPPEAGGLRYCINSAALRFVPYEDMDKEGYSEYKNLVFPETGLP